MRYDIGQHSNNEQIFVIPPMYVCMYIRQIIITTFDGSTCELHNTYIVIYVMLCMYDSYT